MNGWGWHSLIPGRGSARAVDACNPRHTTVMKGLVNCMIGEGRVK